MKTISNSFPIGTKEYEELDEKFGQLCEYAAWQLYKKNNRANHTDEQQDISQELRIALIRAGSYYKRQVYIETCLELLNKHISDQFMKKIVQQLNYLWANKTRHGANRQKFGPHQEDIMEQLMKEQVPENEWPNKSASLVLDAKFTTYCKAITWNAQKSMGKKITREKSIRSGLVSLSEFDYLGSGRKHACHD